MPENVGIPDPFEDFEFEIGDYKVKFKRLKLTEAAKYLPLSFRYINYQAKFNLTRFTQATVMLEEKKNKGEITEEEYQKQLEEIREKETEAQNAMMASFLNGLNELEMDLLFEFLVKSIKEWTLPLPISKESLEQLPYFWVYQMIIYLFTITFYKGLMQATSFRKDGGEAGQDGENNNAENAGVDNKRQPCSAC